ncbi:MULTISPECIES: hypothetical protein [unclassified Streptomyces]|uniref:hypothetical protein n=1 Tax=unclassified Streptomyces TaxID=2593676 RepID=UPI00325124F3
MLMRTDLRGPRPVLWRLVPVMVLAGLLHLLGCAHGAQAAGAPRADSLPVVTAVPFSHLRPSAAGVSALCDHGITVECAADEPAAVGPRTDPLLLPALGGEPLGADAVRASPVRSRAPCCGNCGEGHAEHGRTRAVLGVWRT